MKKSEEENLIKKMSTKICQLTRVVYLLNNKYLDAQSNIEAIRTTYDNELTSIVRQANDYSKDLKERIKKLEIKTDIEEDFKKFKEEVEKKYEKEKEIEQKNEVDKLKKENENKLEEYKSLYDESVRLMKEEIEELKKNYLNKFEEIKKNNQKVVININEKKDKLNKTIKKLKSKHAKELNNNII